MDRQELTQSLADKRKQLSDAIEERVRDLYSGGKTVNELPFGKHPRLTPNAEVYLNDDWTYALVYKDSEEDVYIAKCNPGGVLDIHNHSQKQTCVVLRGRFEVKTFDDIGLSPKIAYHKTTECFEFDSYKWHEIINVSNEIGVLIVAFQPPISTGVSSVLETLQG